MRSALLALALASLALGGCSDSPSSPSAKPGAQRPVGIPEDIWKAYSGAESGVGGEAKDAKDKDVKTKDAQSNVPQTKDAKEKK
jgi:hypothetical protein